MQDQSEILFYGKELKKIENLSVSLSMIDVNVTI